MGKHEPKYFSKTMVEKIYILAVSQVVSVSSGRETG